MYGNRAARSGKEQIKRQSAAEEDDCQVRLDFILDGQEYSLTRTIKGKTGRSEATLFRSGKIDVVSTREVDNAVIRLLGLDLKGFTSSFFARQRELNALSDARPAQRKDQLAQMLGVGRLDSALSHLREDVRDIRQRLEILSQNLIEEDLVRSQQKSKETQLKQLNQIKDDILGQLDAIVIKREHSNKLIEDLSQRQLEHQRLDKEIVQFQSRLDLISSEAQKREVELCEISSLAKERSKLDGRMADFDKVKNRLDEIKRGESQKQERDNLLKSKGQLIPALEGRQTDRLRFKAEASAYFEKLTAKASLSEKLKKRKQAREIAGTEFRTLVSDLKLSESDRDKLENQKGEIDRLGPDAVCEFCLRPLGDHLDDIESHFEQELKRVSKTIGEQKEQLSSVEIKGKEEKESISEIERELDRLIENEKSLSVVQARMAESEVVLEEHQNRLSLINTRLSEIGEIDFDADQLLRTEKEFASRIDDRERLIRITEKMARQPQLESDRNRLRLEKGTISGDLNKARKDIDKIGFDLKRLTTLRLTADRQQDEESHLRVQVERTLGQIRLLISEQETLKKQLLDVIASKKRISELRKKLTTLEKLSVLFAEFRLFLIGRIQPTLSRRTSDLFREMTDGRYQEIELDEEYNLKIFDRGLSHPINRFSGGEIDLANLCFRLAISIEMAAMAKISHNFIILDEIFGSQDIVRRQMIIEGLSRLTNHFPQIIIVSHIEGVKDMVENRLTIERDEFGNSWATVQSK